MQKKIEITEGMIVDCFEWTDAKVVVKVDKGDYAYVKNPKDIYFDGAFPRRVNKANITILGYHTDFCIPKDEVAEKYIPKKSIDAVEVKSEGGLSQVWGGMSEESYLHALDSKDFKIAKLKSQHDKEIKNKNEIIDLLSCGNESLLKVCDKKDKEIAELKSNSISKDEIRKIINELKEKMKNLSYSAPRGQYIEIDSKIRILEKLIAVEKR